MKLRYPFTFLIIITSIISIIIAIIRSNWIFLWVSLEINILSFIPIILINKNIYSLEASIKYFLIQALRSRILLICSISIWYLWINNNIIITLIIIRIIIKLGAAPLHFWFPEVIKCSSWLTCYILRTTQKIIPLSIVAMIGKNSIILSSFGVISALIGGLRGINQNKLRQLISYSSISHIGWILVLIFRKNCFFAIMYFFIYCLLTTPLFIWFIISNISSPLNVRHKFISTITGKWLAPIIFLSLAGIPPLTGFFPKWISFYAIWNLSHLLLILVIGSIIRAFFYINLIFSISLTWPQSQSLISPLSILPVWNLTFASSLLFLFTLPIFILWYCAGWTDNSDDVKHSI